MSEETKSQETQANPLGGAMEDRALAARNAAAAMAASGTTVEGALAEPEPAPEDIGDTVNKQLAQGIPAFGNVLMAVGLGVGNSQKALDASAIAAIKKLNDKKIKVVTQVVQELNEDGQFDATNTQLITNEVSVLTYARPASHRWSNVRVSMDLEVGKFHAEQGLEFNTAQQSTSVGGAFTWGFGGWFDVRHSRSSVAVDTRAEQEVAWSSGQCRIDAVLEGVRSKDLPVAAQITSGPQIYFSQGPVTEVREDERLVARTTVVNIDVRRSDGRPNAGRNIEIDAGSLLPSFTGGSSVTDENNGRVVVTLRRELGGAAGFRRFNVTASFNKIRRTFAITL
ncbi:MAG: hypothetical protein M3P06_15720 [Acidobacteriota bacterium]|nr:hypothetical protein [Acidobacteriota bacterium]